MSFKAQCVLSDSLYRWGRC